MSGARKRTATWLLCVTLGLLLAAPVGAAELLDPSDAATPLAREGLHALFAGDANEAKALLTRWVDEYPEDPLAPLARMKLWWWAILEGQSGLEDALEADFERVRKRAEARLDEDGRDVRALFALGEAHCTFGRLHGIRGSGWAALRSHRAGTPLLEQALALDPDLPAPLTSLGVYHYYSARAPSFLRFLARFLSVQADRQRGLQELWRAASTPGIQQADAAFFLIEVLTNVEDNALEALPLALRMHARHPQSLPFAIALASVQLALDRPDVAVQVLQRVVRDPQSPQGVAVRFFVARTLAASGRASESIQILDDFSDAELESVSWLKGWHAYYRGLAYEQLGRSEEAEAAFRATFEVPEVAESHRFAKRELARSDRELVQRVREAEASLAWDGNLETAAFQLLEVLEADRGDDESQRRARYALGLLALRLGRPARAAQLLSPITDDDVDQAWLVVRPRVRMLQALLWSGQLDEARRIAAAWRPFLGRWGSNLQLELLVQTCLQPSPPPLFEPDVDARPGDREVRFRLKDVGFTSVRLAYRVGADTRSHAMGLRNGFWSLDVPLAPGEHLYRYEIESVHPLPDPEILEVREDEHGMWSVRRVEPVPGS